MSDAAKQLRQLAVKAAEKLIRENSVDALALGSETVKAIFMREFRTVFKAIPILGENPSIAELADFQELLAENAQEAALIATAEAQDFDRVLKMKSSAAAIVSTLAKSVAGVGLSLALKAMIGG